MGLTEGEARVEAGCKNWVGCMGPVCVAGSRARGSQAAETGGRETPVCTMSCVPGHVSPHAFTPLSLMVSSEPLLWCGSCT